MLARRLFSDRGGLLVLGSLIVLVAYVVIGNLFMTPDSAFYVSTFMVTLLGKFLAFAILALSIDLIWGYAGVLSLGHGAFFGLGGYAMGMYLTRQIGDRGVYGNPDLPDFMVFLGYEKLPWFWIGFDQLWFALLMVLLAPGLLALVFGWMAFRSRVSGVYFAIITQALVFALMLAFFRNEMGFGGNNGLTDFKDIAGFDITARTTRVALFVLTALALAVAYLACRWIVTSRFGHVAIAIRDAESRVRFAGYRVEAYKLWLFTFSAMLAGIAGALYVPQVGIINPGEFSPIASIEAVLWVAVGGRGTLFGPILGAFAVNGGKTWLTTTYPEVWLFALGALFVLVTLFLPKGIAGLIARRRSRARPVNEAPADSGVVPAMADQAAARSDGQARHDLASTSRKEPRP
ncbi:MAG: urea ABC transporter permease subunit UrtC [Thioalkalivibrionaceae bacterium]